MTDESVVQAPPLDPSETLVAGSWVLHRGSYEPDPAALRIEALLRTQLVSLGVSQNGEDTLSRDPRDGRLWEVIFEQSSLHGGGPPTLRVIDDEDAKRKYPHLWPSNSPRVDRQ